jgi:nucleobase:cation symporter-1, NCS1 family
MEKAEIVKIKTEHKEYDALEPVPAGARSLKFGEMVATWVGANANNGTWYVGGVVAGAAFGGAALVTLVANPIAYIIMAFIGFIGYKVGTSTMSLTRPCFGVKGSYLPTVLNITQFIGWTAVNTFIAAISISFILKDFFGWPAFGEAGANKGMLVGILIMSILHLISISVGSKSVKMVEKIGVVFILVLGIWETYVVLKQVPLDQIVSWRPPSGSLLPMGAAMDAMAAFSLGWVPAICEFTRYGKTKATATIAPIIGANAGLFWFAFVGIIATIGTAITTGVYDPNNSDPSTIASKLGLGAIALLVIIITSTTANAVNLMAAGISLTNISRKIKSISALLIVTVLSALLTLVPLFLSSFLNSFIMFLDYIGMVFGPIFAIMIVDFYMVKKKKYDTDALNKQNGKYWFNGGYNVLAISVWVISAIIFLLIRKLPLFVNSIGAIYPIIVIAGVLYYSAIKIFDKKQISTTDKEIA